MNILQDITKHNFVLVLLDEEGYVKKLRGMVKSIEKTHFKICFVCLSRPYNDVVKGLQEEGMNIKKFFFIDTLSSYYKKHVKKKDCLFLSSPVNLTGIMYAIKKVLKEENCNVILFDTMSSLLIYQDSSEIVRFTHSLMSEQQETKKIFLVLKKDSIPEEDVKSLSKDLELFADKTINE